MFPLSPITMIPWVLAAVLGIGAAVQTGRLSSAKNEFREYKIEQQEIVQRQIDAANKQRKEASDAYRKVQEQLEVSIEAGDVLKRCIAAGKCGVQHSAPRSPGKSVPAAKRANATRSNPVPAGREATAQVSDVFIGDGITPQVVTDCARTTLQLNALQTDIEKQPGYNK